MEGVGWEEDFAADASLFVMRGDKLLHHCRGEVKEATVVKQGDANLNPVGRVPVNYTGYDPEFLGKGPTWITYAGYSYQLLGNDSEHPDRQRWLYQGPQRGFLAQELIPPFLDTVIEHVEGTYGIFEGPDALEKYAAVKEGWETLWRPLYDAGEGCIFPESNGHGATRFAAWLWRFRV